MQFHEWADKWGVPPAAVAEWLSQLTPPDVNKNEQGSESRVGAELRLKAVGYGALWRNNAGAYSDDTGRMIRYGLGNDSANWWKDWRSGDYAGITSVKVQPHHVGRTFGVFTMIEAKKPDWNPRDLNRPSNTRERAQMTCLTHVASLGGIAGFATSTADYERYIRDWSA
ncbi:hypothetical protein EVB39_128 [Rhizobium phage RHph_TM3_3_9]|nr:hypothetical protein EVB39_128 [Rhizobium phage RHph_TM3_3_9]QIG68649.1 hypothetical protein EVB66_128 [Rhizobium phage RHph_TM3_3_13]QIG74507.1 hypothetical protein EVC09_127 [Rhizobium phage RHph_TM3_3_10]QXV74621.1 hypothetical protein [Rhizobium phage RHEph19]